MMHCLDGVHVAEQIVERLALDHGSDAIVPEQRVVTDRQLAAHSGRSRKSPRILFPCIDGDGQPLGGIAQFQSSPRPVGPNPGFGPEEYLLVVAVAARPRFVHHQELATLALWPIEHHGELPANPGEMSHPDLFHRAQLFVGVVVVLADAENLLSGSGPGRLGANGEQDLAILLDPDPDRKARASGLLENPVSRHLNRLRSVRCPR